MGLLDDIFSSFSTDQPQDGLLSDPQGYAQNSGRRAAMAAMMAAGAPSLDPRSGSGSWAMAQGMMAKDKAMQEALQRAAQVKQQQDAEQQRKMQLEMQQSQLADYQRKQVLQDKVDNIDMQSFMQPSGRFDAMSYLQERIKAGDQQALAQYMQMMAPKEKPADWNIDPTSGTRINKVTGVVEPLRNVDGSIYENPERKAAAQDKKDQKTSQQLEKFTGELAKTGIPEFESALSNIENLIAKNKAKGDIPGYGATGMMPGFLLSDDGKELRQAVATVKNIQLKNRSGGAVTDNELNRYLEELGSGALSGDDQLLRGLAGIRRNFDATKQNLLVGESPETLKAYLDRGGDARIVSGLLNKKEGAWPSKQDNQKINFTNYERQQSIQNAKNAMMKNPGARAAIIQRLESAGITDHGL